MPRPLIGLNCDYAHRPSGEKRLALNVCYPRSVEEAGGVPVLLPWQKPRTLARTLDRLDGLLLIGGDDLDPAVYKARRHPSVKPMDPEREAFDLELARQALSRRIPILGICFGCQLLNIARGGTLVQDIPSEVPGALKHREGWHPVSVAPDSRLRRVLGVSRMGANSFHHQSVGSLGKGLKATAWTSDGVVEGIEDPDHPFLLGVQWHPERCTRSHPLHQRLFQALVKASV